MKKRKLLISTLLAAFACSFVGAICSVASLQVKAEEITYGTPVVYDLWDLANVKAGVYGHASSGATTRGIGQMPSNHNAAFKTIITDDYYTEEQKTGQASNSKKIMLSWLMFQTGNVGNNYSCNGYPYQLHWQDGAMKIRYDNNPTDTTANTTVGAEVGWGTIFNTLRNTKGLNGKVLSTPDVILYNKEEFSLEFGCKDILTDGVWTGNYVYAKINDIEVINYTDTTEYFDDRGTYFGASADASSWTFYGCKTTYDFVDVTMGEVPEGATFTEGAKYSIPVKNGSTLEIPLEEGYAVKTAMLGDTDVTDKISWSPAKTALDCSALTAGEYTLTLTTSQNVIDDVTVYDLYDLKGVKEYQTTSENSNVQNVGQFATNSNVAFRSIISYPEADTKHLYINYLILKSSESEHFAYGGYGYQFLFKDGVMSIRYDNTPTVNDGIETATTLSKAQLNSLLPTIDNLVGTGKINVTDNAFYLGKEAFTFEFGCAKYLVNDEWTGNYVYVKINGVEIMSFIDTGANYQAKETLGKYTGRGADGRGYTNYLYTTTYTDSEIAYKILDTFSMENGASTRNSNNGLRFTMSVSESKWTELQNYIGADKVYSSVTFGMVIVPADYVASKPLTVENLFGNSAVYYLMEKETDGSWKAYNGSLTPIFHLTGNSLTNYQFKGSIVNLEDWNITRNFVGLGYVKYVENDGDEGYVLADYYGGDIANNTRSIYQVAKSAYEADNTRTQLKTNYLDKVTTVTVNYYDASTNEKLATETIYGVIGQTAFAPLRSFDGYTFIAGNNGNATQITVSATGENVLNYYFTANN